MGALTTRCSGARCINWTVDANKLGGKHQHVSSPRFELALGAELPEVVFRAMICASGATSLKRSHGQGCVELKCEPEIPRGSGRVMVCASIGDGRRLQGP